MPCKPYALDVINALRCANIQEKISYMEAMYLKNKNFFEKESPGVYELITSSENDRFEIKLTDNFLDIFDSQTGEYLHPQGQLDNYAQALGQWVHGAWIDLLNFQVSISKQEDSIHNQFCRAMEMKTLAKFPGLPNVNVTKRINLKVCGEADELRYAPAVAFMGIAHGLHIIAYLNKTMHSHIVLYEPDKQKFLLSCHFLDYELLKNSCKMYYLAIGEEHFSLISKVLLQDKQISPFSWLRVLPYEKTADYMAKVAQLKSLQMSTNELFFPIDMQLKAFKAAVGFFEKKIPLLSSIPKINKKANIVLIGSGPSLDLDLPWLKQNQSKLIIFSALSAVKSLVKNQIKIDFIFTLDSKVNVQDVKSSFELPDEVPIVGVYHTAEEFLTLSNPLLLCGIQRERNLVRFKQPVDFYGASTINLALGFALLCEPENIYLIGCDCAFTKEGKITAVETAHNKELEKTFHEQSTSLLVKSNANPEETVPTNVMLYDISYSMEVSISFYSKGSNVINLSKTGAYIGGTTSALSENIILEDYSTKYADIEEIITRFQPAQKNSNWFAFDIDGHTQLNKYKKSLLDALKSPVTSWPEAIELIDSITYDVFAKLDENEVDGRLGCYQNLFAFMFRYILNNLLALDNIDDALLLHTESIKIFEEVIANLQWPNEMKGF